MDQANSGAVSSLHHRLAGERRYLLELEDEAESATATRELMHRLGSEYAPLMVADDRPHAIYQFLADGDIRLQDPRYRSHQERRIGNIIAYTVM